VVEKGAHGRTIARASLLVASGGERTEKRVRLRRLRKEAGKR
jgi:hypothetical protein